MSLLFSSGWHWASACSKEESEVSCINLLQRLAGLPENAPDKTELFADLYLQSFQNRMGICSFIFMQAPLILTVQLDETSQLFFNEKRKRHFPPERNFLDAHLTLFHHLPDDEDITIKPIENICRQQKLLSLQVTDIKNIGKGVAYKIDSKELIGLYKRLQKEWISHLTTQDRQGLWPHITIQNKVTAEEAKKTLETEKQTFKPFTAIAIGFTLWQYLNGPWQWYRSFLFAR